MYSVEGEERGEGFPPFFSRDKVRIFFPRSLTTNSVYIIQAIDNVNCAHELERFVAHFITRCM